MCVRTWAWCAFYMLCVCNVHLYTLQLLLAISITFFLTQFSFLFTIQKFSSCFFFALSLSRFYFFYRFVFKCIFILWSPSLFVCVCASANAHFTVSVFEYSFTYLRLHYIHIRIQYIIWCRKWYIIKCQLFCCRWWCSCCHHRWPFLRLLFCCNFWILFCMSVCACECLYKMSTKYDTCLFMSHSACSHFEHREKPAAPFLRVPCDHIHLDVYLFNDYSMLHK